MVSVIKADTRALLGEFIQFPFDLYHQEKTWVPPFKSDEFAFHNPGLNPLLKESDTVLFLAKRNGSTVGRVMGIIHHPHNQKYGERTARFFKLDCVKDIEVCHSLLNAVEAWAYEKGMNRVIGPFGFSDKDPQGVRVEGFNFLPVIAAPCQPEWLHMLIEVEGYRKYFDCVSYLTRTSTTAPEKVLRIAQRASVNTGIRVLNFSKRSELIKWIVPVFRLVNETYKDLYGFMPLSEEEMQVLAKQYIPVLDPAFTKLIIDQSEQPIAFIISMPNLSRGIQKTHGRLFPFGFIHLLWEMKRSNQLDLLLGAVLPQWQNKGIMALLAIEILKAARTRGLIQIDSHLILEENHKMRGVMEKFGGELYKRFRVYSKDIS